jgi:hypothetical protein
MKGAISSWSLDADIKIDPVDLIQIAQFRIHWRALVNLRIL